MIQKSFNLRLLKKLIQSLSIFYFLDLDSEYSEDIKNSILFKTFLYVYGDKFKKNIRSFTKANIHEVEDDIEIALQKSFVINKQKLIDELNKIDKRTRSYIEKDDIRSEIIIIYNKFKFDLNYRCTEFANKLKKVCDKNIEKIVDIIGLPEFIQHIENLQKFDSKNKSEYKELFKKAIEEYIDILIKDDSIYKKTN